MYLIDYGYMQSVAHDNIREAMRETFSFPAMAFECRLSGVAPLSDEDGFSRLSTLAFKRAIKDNEGQPLRGTVVRSVDDVVEVR